MKLRRVSQIGTLLIGALVLVVGFQNCGGTESAIVADSPQAATERYEQLEYQMLKLVSEENFCQSDADCEHFERGDGCHSFVSVNKASTRKGDLHDLIQDLGPALFKARGEPLICTLQVAHPKSSCIQNRCFVDPFGGPLPQY